MTRALLAALCLLLVGCGVALAQGTAAVPLPASGIPWGQVIGALGAVAAAVGALVKVGLDVASKVNVAIGNLDARATAFEQGIRDGFQAGLAELREIKSEQRRSSDAAIHTSVRLDAVDRHVERIRERMGDDVTGEVPRPRG